MVCWVDFCELGVRVVLFASSPYTVGYFGERRIVRWDAIVLSVVEASDGTCVGGWNNGVKTWPKNCPGID